MINTRNHKRFGSGALPGKIMLVWIIEYNKTDAYFNSGQVK